MRGYSPQQSSSTLTQTERRVLQVLASGKHLDGAARELGLSGDQVRSLVRRACHATGTETPLEAVCWATRRGLL